MKINQLQKALNTYEKIKALDAEIISIEKHAKLISNGDAKIDLRLSVQNLLDVDKEEKEKQQEKIDEEYKSPYGDLSSLWSQIRKPSFEIKFPHGGISGFQEAVKPHTKNFEISLIDTIALEVLGIILSEKLKNREKLIFSLKRLGIK